MKSSGLRCGEVECDVRTFVPGDFIVGQSHTWFVLTSPVLFVQNYNNEDCYGLKFKTISCDGLIETTKIHFHEHEDHHGPLYVVIIKRIGLRDQV